MGEHVTSRPPEANTGPPGHHPPDDERTDAALRQLVRVLARIAVAEALGIADSDEAARDGSAGMSRSRTPTPASERLLTIADVADRCQVSPRSVRRWIDEDRLQVIRLGRSVRVSEGDLAKFLSHCQRSK